MGAVQSASDYTLLPELLRRQNYSTYALGKWDVGFIDDKCHPTRHANGGYDSWLGYYEACLQDYWAHTFGLGTTIACQDYGANASSVLKDLSNCTGSACVGVGAQLTGTYNARVFTAEAMRLIRAHAAAASSRSLFLYLAYHNVHLACGASYGSGLHAPCSTVHSAAYERTALDRFKLQGAMLTELDYGVGNTTEELKRTGMWENTVVAFTSDNGGPLNHGTNAGPLRPLRGGKWTFWEGGVNVACVLAGPALRLPVARQGSVWPGLAHVSDFYSTLFVGVAGGDAATIVAGKSGPRDPDSINLWPAILAGGASPREEVVHQVNCSYFDEGVQSMRWKNFKLIRSQITNGAGDARIVSWPAPSPAPVVFGLSGGTVGEDPWPAGPERQDHCRSAIGKRAKGTIDCRPYCLFDLKADPSESHDLRCGTTALFLRSVLFWGLD